MCEDEEDEEIMPPISTDEKDPKIVKEGQNRLSWAFLKGVECPMLIRNINLLRQAEMELVFSEKNVENPELRKKRIEQYIC
jgi:hypothetical protein